jgi:hypothetical protein
MEDSDEKILLTFLKGFLNEELTNYKDPNLFLDKSGSSRPESPTYSQ